MEMHRLVLLSSYWDKVAANLPKAVVNTAVGITVVFIALIFISLVISMFRYVSVLENWLEARKEKKMPVSALTEEAADRTVQQITEKEEAELVSDLELVAVITAAVYAYEESLGNTVTDGLYVRSIRKSRPAQKIS